jgi:hypothetical protein
VGKHIYSKEFFMSEKEDDYDPTEEECKQAEANYKNWAEQVNQQSNEKENSMSDEKEYDSDSEKMLNWNKKLGEQSEFVKKAIDPLLTWEFAYIKRCLDDGWYDENNDYKNFLEKRNEESPNWIKEHILKNSDVSDLYRELTGNGPDWKPATEYLKSLGIRGEYYYDEIHIFNDNYLESLYRDYVDDPELESMENQDKQFYQTLHKQLEKQPEPTQTKTSEQSPVSDRQIETAQKTGYVQGVCESVLAFNNDENRKIMSEATMTFLSKKLLSEMNVTKDMAQKFANPETYKALEQSVFAQKQEQQLEQTQSQGRGI